MWLKLRIWERCADFCDFLVLSFANIHGSNVIFIFMTKKTDNVVYTKILINNNSPWKLWILDNELNKYTKQADHENIFVSI